jgi:dihydrofolate synthase/folylpolyglutamate synthase
MRRLCSLLGMPQNRFASIHIVGTNGKTSVARMTAALLEANGVSAGAYVSPHIRSWRERILIGNEPISEEAFDQAVERAEQAAQVADRSAGDDGPVTQFELLTAAAFVAFASARVQWGVIEAGLGGRLDATNVIPSQLTVLTSVGLDHTEWLGDTVEEIATEKLAVLRDHTILVTGELPPEVEPVVQKEVQSRHAERRGFAQRPERNPEREVPFNFMTHNSSIAGTAAMAALDGGFLHDPLPVDEQFPIPGRAQLEEGDPDVIYDAAHNPDGARALAGILPWFSGDRDITCCLAILEGKDAAGIVEGLASACARFVCTEIPPEQIEGSGRPGGRSRPALELAALCEKAGVDAEAIPDPIDAWRQARELARERDGVALAAGSHYLLACIWTERPAESS